MGIAVNRYTKITPNKYNPRSFQELMQAPAYMRGKHDSTDAALAAATTSLAKTDNMNVHSQAADAERARLQQEITNQSETLARSGFTRNTTSDMLRLNADYQQSIGPTGKLGIIQGAKTAYKVNFDSFMKGALKKWDRATALRNWQIHAKNYEETQVDGNISDIGQLGAPEKIELSDKLKQVHDLLGKQVVEDISAGKYEIKPVGEGFAVVDRSGRRIVTSNAKNIQDGMKMLQVELKDPNSAWRKSMAFEGVDPNNIIKQVNAGLSAMLENNVKDTRKENHKFIGDVLIRPVKPSFITTKIKGIDVNSIDRNSPLLQLEAVTKESYNKDGYIIPDSNQRQFKTYKDKVDAVRLEQKLPVRYDKERDIWIGTAPSYGNSSGDFDIPKDAMHIKQQITQLRDKSPFLIGKNDRQIKTILEAYKKDIESNFVSTIDLPNSDYKWFNRKMFGTELGEGSVGLFNDKKVTISGHEINSSDVYKKLGYSNITDFKTKGKPSITGFSVATGKFTATVKNSNMESKNIFIESNKQLRTMSQLSMEVSTLMLNAKPFAKLSNPLVKNGISYSLYLINNFTNNPYVVATTRTAPDGKDFTEASFLIQNQNGSISLTNAEDKKIDYNTLSGLESSAIIESDLFKVTAGIKKNK